MSGGGRRRRLEREREGGERGDEPSNGQKRGGVGRGRGEEIEGGEVWVFIEFDGW